MNHYLQPNWPAAANVRAYMTTRANGVSAPPYASFNLSLATGDQPAAVMANRQQLQQELNLPTPPLWLDQQHTNIIYELTTPPSSMPLADAAFTRQPRQVLGVLTADCLPILICDRQGSLVAAVHAGWRGIVAGIIEQSIATLTKQVAASELIVWLGGAISKQAFVVDQPTKTALIGAYPEAELAFTKVEERYQADLALLVQQRLAYLGVDKIYQEHYCTYQQEQLFFSYRRDGAQTGRMASVIWLI